MPEKMKTILIVDDEAANRFLFANILRAADREVVMARDGAEALAQSRRLHPDLILLDLMMPGMSGIDVLKDLKSNAATRDIPVIVVTAMDDFFARSRICDAGTVAILTKPVNRQEFAACVEQLLRSCGSNGAGNQSGKSNVGQAKAS